MLNGAKLRINEPFINTQWPAGPFRHLIGAESATDVSSALSWLLFSSVLRALTWASVSLIAWVPLESPGDNSHPELSAFCPSGTR